MTQKQQHTTLDDERAVRKSTPPRRVQARSSRFDISLPHAMLKDLLLDEQSAEADVRLIKGHTPVLIDEPCIVIRPHDARMQTFGDQDE